ncbi:MAG: leucyl/phenylalanyl-tRNA--protein transferase [Gammaproteobacteria bacterium]
MSTFDLSNALYWVSDCRLAPDFPPTARALTEPDGLLAIGGDLSPARLLAAYRRGIFPWYAEGQPIMWWSPDPRSVLTPDSVHVSRRLARTLRQRPYTLTLDAAFEQVVDGCAAPRDAAGGTWITADMRAAYITLHELGSAHSIECWHGTELAGGLYGLAIGCVFFGESMFSRRRDASKVALVTLVRHLWTAGFGLFDCQIHNPHLARMGARTIPRSEFEAELARLVDRAPTADPWAGGAPA